MKVVIIMMDDIIMRNLRPSGSISDDVGRSDIDFSNGIDNTHLCSRNRIISSAENCEPGPALINLLYPRED